MASAETRLIHLFNAKVESIFSDLCIDVRAMKG